MSTSDYHIHIDRDQYDNLWLLDEESEAFPFAEDMEDIDRMIEEEIGTPKRRRRSKKRV